MSSGDDPIARRGFPSTHWSVIEAARQERNLAQRPAMTDVLRRYVPALRAHLLMRRSVPRDRMDDVLQGFISSKLLASDLIGRADRAKGKFRTFLATALDRYVVSVQRHDRAEKRDVRRTHQMDSEFDQAAASGAAGAAGAGGAGGSDPVGGADLFDVAWARQILRETLTRMRAQCERDGRADVWGVFEARILKPSLEGAQPPTYEQVVERFGYRAPTQMWNAVRTGKQIFARLLRAVVAEHADSDDDVEAELRDLREICARLPQDPGGAAYPS